MRRILPLVLVLALVAGAIGMAGTGTAASGRPEVRGVTLDTDVDPVSAEFLRRELRAAERAHAALFLIQMDTPGGLSSSMRRIVSGIENSPLPVAVWVGPDGARAASAGAYISAASDELGMAPATNIGSATPISGNGGGDLDQKVKNDAAAQIAALARQHGRDAGAYRAMVTQKLNLTAHEAVGRHVAETVQPTRAAFVRWLDGRPGKHGQVIHTAGAAVHLASLPWYMRLLELAIDPNLLFLLFALGVGALGYEVFHPGAIVPGVVGAMALLVALLGLAVVPFNWVGIAFILLAFALFAAEVHVGGFGVIAVGGIASLAFGGAILFGDSGIGAVSRPAIVATALAIGVVFTLAARISLNARRRPVATGAAQMNGALGEVRTPVGLDGGQVFVNGELWAARSADGSLLPRGKLVRVVTMRELVVTVEPMEGTV